MYDEFVRRETEVFIRRITKRKVDIDAALFALNTEVYRLLLNADSREIDSFLAFLQKRQPCLYTFLIAIPPIKPPDYPGAKPVRVHCIQPWQILVVPAQNSATLLAEASRYGYNFRNPAHLRTNQERLHKAGFVIIPSCPPRDLVVRTDNNNKYQAKLQPNPKSKMDDTVDDNQPFAVKLICEGATPFKERNLEELQKWMWLPNGVDTTTFRVSGISPKAFAHFTAYLSTLITTKKLDVAAQVIHADEVPLEELALLYYFAQVVKMEPLALLLADQINKQTPDRSTADMAAWLDAIGITRVTIAPSFA